MPKALSLALEALSRREHSAHELIEKLKRKGCNEEDSIAAVDECQRLGYQSDCRYVDGYCRMRVAKGDGPMKIEQFLRAKGVDSETIRARIDKEPWEAHAQVVWEKKCKPLGETTTANEKAKQQRFMLNRGFSSALIADLFKVI